MWLAINETFNARDHEPWQSSYEASPSPQEWPEGAVVQGFPPKPHQRILATPAPSPPALQPASAAPVDPWLVAQAANAPQAFKSLGTFEDEYTPLQYVADRILVRGSLYSLTARTGHAKTTFLAAVSIAVATGEKDILGVRAKAGRVVYMTFENSEDFRMKMIAARVGHDKTLAECGNNLFICDTHISPETAAFQLRAMGGEFTLVIVDTLQAGFDGSDFNDNKAVLDYVRRVRSHLTRLPGMPAVIIAAHPVKNAEPDNLIPYGGGSILNEVDGNLTLWRTGGTSITTLHWQGKFRGPEFAPMAFEIECAPCGLKDAEGRDVKPPHVKRVDAISAMATAAEQSATADQKKLALFQAISANPLGGYRNWGVVAGIAKTSAERFAKQMVKDGLLAQSGQAIVPTPLGQEWLKDATKRMAAPTLSHMGQLPGQGA